MLAKAPVRSELVFELVSLGREIGADEGWEGSYAERLVERFGA